MYRLRKYPFCGGEIVYNFTDAHRNQAMMLQFTRKWQFLMIFLAHLYRIPLAKTEEIKIWRMDYEFTNLRNWKAGRLPCENDRIIFSDSFPVITVLPETLVASELILPENGEIIFPENATIELTGGTREGDCKGTDALFLPPIDFWYDPENWNITSDHAFPNIPNRHNLAVPHAFQIPCSTDKVLFPDKTFQVNDLFPIATVGSVNISGTSYSQSEFSQLVRTHIGSMLFPNTPSLRIRGSHCSDETGCMCGNDAPHMLPTVCNQATPFCPSVDCYDTFIPVGNCCPVCGAQIKMKIQQKFKMSRLISFQHSFLNKEKYRGVESFTAKTYKGDIQSVFVDGDEYKGRASRAAQEIHDALSSDMSSGNSYGIEYLEIFKSEDWKRGVPTYDQYIAGGMSPGGTAALVIVLIVGIGLAVGFFIYKKRHIPGFNFARFDLRGDKIELQLGTTPHDELQPTDLPEASASEEEQSKGFDNPVYGTAVEEATPSSVESPNEIKDFVENPMFMIFEDSSEQTKGEELK